MKYYTNILELKNDIPPGKTITLIGGCFDLLHVGHLHLINYANTLADILVVAVLSDNYIKGYKKKSRPIIGQDNRARMLCALNPVDYVYLAEISPNDYGTLSILGPNNLVFGIDADEEKMKRRMKKCEDIKSLFPGLEIFFLERFMGDTASTSHIIEKIKIVA